LYIMVPGYNNAREAKDCRSASHLDTVLDRRDSRRLSAANQSKARSTSQK
jgi:hypothetical protein